MMTSRIIYKFLWVVCVLSFTVTALHAAALVNEAHVVAANDSLAATLPAVKSFDVAVAGDYTITLTDVGKQSNGANAFLSLSLAIYQNSHLIKLVAVPEASAGTAGISQLDKVTLAAGTYSAQIIGVTSGASLYSAAVNNSSSTLLSMAGAITKPGSSAGNDFSSLQSDLGLTAGHSYRIALNDIAFPAALDSLQATMVVDGTNLQCQLSSATPGPCDFVAGSTNKLLALATKSASAVAGMYSIKIVDNTNSQIVLASTYPVGAMPDPISISLPLSGMYQLITTDLQTPDPLSTLQMLLLQDIDVLSNQSAAGTSQLSTFNANAGNARLYVIGSGTSNGGIYGTQITQAGKVIYSNASVIAADSTATQTGYYFNATLPSAGNYVLNLNDLNFPQAFKKLSVAVTRGATTIGTLNTSGMLSLNNMSAGEIQINVIATPNASGQGLFGLTLAASSGATLLNTTQGVGGTFHAIPMDVVNAGTYKLNVNDMQAPQRLGQLLMAVTRDNQFIGEVIGSGAVDVDATPGKYVLNIIATTDTAANTSFGMYGVAFGSAPSITLTTSATSVTTGSSVFVNWTTSDTASCLASDGWSGSKALSGNESFGPVTADTKLTLTCSGITGNASKSITLQVKAATPDTPPAKSGGGGAMQWWMLMMLLAMSGLIKQSKIQRE